MHEPTTIFAFAALGLGGLAMVLLAGLNGWRGWLDVKRLEIELRQPRNASPVLERIELSDLKERVRKLESIAACVDP